MRQDADSQSKPTRELTIDADWISTSGMVLLFAASLLLLVQAVRHFPLGDLAQTPLHRNFLSIASATLPPFILFSLAFGLRRVSFKIACVLLGVSMTGKVIPLYLPVLSTTYAVVLASSLLRQLALCILLVAIARWFQTVIRWERKS